MEKSNSFSSPPDSLLSPQSTDLSGKTLRNDSVDLESQSSKDCTTKHKTPFFLRFLRQTTQPEHNDGCDSDAEDDAVTRLKTRRIEDNPQGYPRLACFLSSDHNFSTYRGFSYLHARLLLNLQDEIRALEKKLDSLDDMDGENAQEGARTGLKSRVLDVRLSAEQGEVSRQALLAEIQRKILQYDELLLKAREITALQQPSNRDYRSVRNWIAREAPIAETEQSFIEHREDVITLRHGRECAGFDGLVESGLRYLPRRLTSKLFLTPELRAKTSTDICYFSSSRVDTLVNLIITSVIFVLLVIPVMAMYKLTSYSNRDSKSAAFQAIGVLVVFTLIFGAAMSILTRARRHELFAASAAYCAVLVVFIGNFGNLN